MWVAKVRLRHKGCVWTPGTKKHVVTLLFHRITEYEKGKSIFTVAAVVAKGNSKNIRAYIDEIKKNPAVKSLDVRGNFMISVTRHRMSEARKEIFSTAYNPQIFEIKPILVKGGDEYWEIACWNKKPISDFANAAIKYAQGKLYWVKQAQLEDIFIPHLMPALSEKQQRALDIAIEKGYYSWPRKTNLEKMAGVMGVSLPTFQEHLRKAEAKVIPHLTEAIP